jgi:outer membrane protein assembly factor BamB
MAEDRCGMRRLPAVALTLAVPLLLAGAARAAPVPGLAAAAAGAEVVAASGVRGGLVAHVGAGDPAAWAAFTAGLRCTERYLVHGLYRDPEQLPRVYEALRPAMAEGAVSAELWTQRGLPYRDGLVNLLLADGLPDDVEILRVLAPGGVALRRTADGWERLDKPRPKSIDDWPHALYNAGNNAVCHDLEVGPPEHLQWLAPPLNTRHHEHLSSVSVAVSAGGRLFSVIDEAPVASIHYTPEWALVARDAFSGVLLWRRALGTWEPHLRPFRSGPPELSRGLVATPERVYATLARGAPVSALDAATGETLAEYPETAGTEEILHHEGILYLAARASETRPAESATSQRPRRLLALDTTAGTVLWQTGPGTVLPLSLAASRETVVFLTAEALVCLEARSGHTRWQTPRAVAQQRPGWSAPTVVLHDGVVLCADRQAKPAPPTDPMTGKPMAAWLAEGGWPGELTAYAADSGKPLWSTLCAESYHGAMDVFVADALVWVGQSRARQHADFTAGRDLRTGEVKRTLDTTKAFETTMPHHRCHRNRATERYLVMGRTGVEFIDLRTGAALRHHWVRGTCQYGTLPCNGLLYGPPHSCACYIEGKLTGYLALAPKRDAAAASGEAPPESRRQTGAALAAAGPVSEAVAVDEWPTYRGDARRSACTAQTIPAELGQRWEARPGQALTSPIVAGRRVFVADLKTGTVQALDADSGRALWQYTAGGVVDSPPTVAGGRALFGAADGWLYCLDAATGGLVWRFRVAPEDRRIVAFDRVESPWPVHGSVLVDKGSVYAAAGRSSYLDGGIRLCRLGLERGELLAERVVTSRDPETGEQPAEPILFEMPGAQPDVLALQGGQVTMRHLAYDPQTLEPREPKRHVYSPAGFLNNDWWHRTYWIDGTHFYSGYIGWYFAGREAIAGRLLAFSDTLVCGYSYRPEFYRGSSERQYHLFAADRGSQPDQPPPDYARANRDYPHSGGGKFGVSFRWSRNVPLVVRAMALGEDRLFAAGPPAAALRRVADYRGRSGALLVVVNTQSGETQAEHSLDALPGFDGLAAAYGRLYLTLEGGRLLCLDARTAPGVQPLPDPTARVEAVLPPLAISREPGLAAHWRFDEAVGSRARDSSGNGHEAEVEGQWAQGPYGACIRSDGTPAAVVIADGPALRFGTGDFTLALRVHLEAYDCRLLGKEAFPQTWWVINVLPDGRAELVLGNGTGPDQSVRAASATPLARGGWSSLVYVVARGQGAVHCYLDGRLDSTKPIPAAFAGALDVPGRNLYLPSSHKPFAGLLDELRVYHRALTDAEVAALEGSALVRPAAER